jgi:hypothetical protein
MSQESKMKEGISISTFSGWLHNFNDGTLLRDLQSTSNDCRRQPEGLSLWQHGSRTSRSAPQSGLDRNRHPGTHRSRSQAQKGQTRRNAEPCKHEEPADDSHRRLNKFKQIGRKTLNFPTNLLIFYNIYYKIMEYFYKFE